jgi:predicted ATP-binding protein involved in virulence
MAISHVFAEGVGPFKSVHLDLRGPDGKPSLGPHILAGVNGSGKSTLLKAIAWCLTRSNDGFPVEEWKHYMRGDSPNRVLLVLEIAGYERYAWAITSDRAEGWRERLSGWVSDSLVGAGLDSNSFPFRQKRLRPHSSGDLGFNAARYGGPKYLGKGRRFRAAAYSSSPSVRYVDRPNMALSGDDLDTKNFSFGSTVQNEAIQSWLLRLYSKRAIAHERNESSSRYTASFEALQRGLRRVCGDDVAIEVDIEPTFQPRLQIGSQTLNFSQIPDGVRVTFGWLADFLMRAESGSWASEVGDVRTAIILFDEIEGFLHPLWQRRLLPALREALPTTQSIITSHSPFVISSCPDAMIHVLKTNSDGSAYAEPPVPAPIGESITSTLKDIFGVESRFDVETEEQLGEWNELKKAQMKRKLGTAEEAQFRKLSEALASRSEELRSLVTTVPELPKSTVEGLTQMSARRSRKSSLASR